MGRKRTGRIVELGENRYEITIQTRKNGKRGYFGEVFNGTLEEAEEFKKECLAQIEYFEKHPEKALTINDLMKQFIKMEVTLNVKEKTLEDYENNLRRYIKPLIGKNLVIDFKVRDIRQFYERLREEKKIGALTIRKVHFHLKGAFRFAVEQEYRPDNPFAFIKAPKGEKSPPVNIPTINEALEILNACRNVSEKALWMTAYFTGMRPEEYLALRWSDVNYERKVIRVERVVVKLKKFKRPIIDKDPKTKLSRRLQPLSDELAATLKEHRHAWLKIKMASGKEWSSLDDEKDLIFCTGNGNIILQSNHNRNLKAVIRAANGKDLQMIRRQKEKCKRENQTWVDKKYPQKVREDLVPYSMRHAFASHLLETGSNLKEVSDLLAHSSIRLTSDTYVHLSDEKKTHAVNRLEEMVLRKKAGSEK